MSTALLVGISYFGAPAAVSAQDVLSSCDPATGLTPRGTQCVSLTPVDPTRYQTPIDAAGASRYQSVNVGELAETYECNRSGATDGAYATGGAILIEDCGAPLVIDPSTYKEFVGYAGNAAPTPVYTPPPAPVAYVAPPPAPVAYVPPPAPVAYVPPPPLPPVYAATPLATKGLGYTGLITAGLGAAALAGIAALAFSNDSDSTSSTQ